MRLAPSNILKLRQMLATRDVAKVQRSFVTGLAALDQIAPHSAFARSAIHEVLYEPENPPAAFLAAILARSVAELQNPENGSLGVAITQKPILWCDAKHELYPPALLSQGTSLLRNAKPRLRDAGNCSRGKAARSPLSDSSSESCVPPGGK